MEYKPTQEHEQSPALNTPQPHNFHVVFIALGGYHTLLLGLYGALW